MFPQSILLGRGLKASLCCLLPSWHASYHPQLSPLDSISKDLFIRGVLI